MRKVQPFHMTSAKHETVRKSDRITKFKECIKLEPYYTCNVYNKCLYRKSVSLHARNRHKELTNNRFHFIPSYGKNFYICKSCEQEVQKNKIPCQGVCN